MNKIYRLRPFLLATALALLLAGNAFPQGNAKKAAGKPPQKQKQAQNPKTQAVQNNTVIKFTPEQLDAFRQQSTDLVKFFEGSLNFLADKSNPVSERQVVITQSYLRYFQDAKVQVEDDLDEKRIVPVFKDAPAYLTDVDFFFKSAKFRYDIQGVDVMTNDLGQTYFKVTANRNLIGINVNGDSVNSNLVRYIEINYDDKQKQLKIVSVYTTKINEKDDMRNWWMGLSAGWKIIFGKDRMVNDTLKLSSIPEFTDSTATINGAKINIDGNRIYSQLSQIIGMKSIDISGNTEIATLDPLSKLSSLTEIRAANTPISDLMPLRNLNALEVLDISGTSVSTLAPIRYAINLKELNIKKTSIRSLDILAPFTFMEVLDISNTPVDSLDALKDMAALKTLTCQGSKIRDLKPLAGKENLEFLNITSTQVSDLTPLKECKGLMIIFLSETKVSALDPIGDLPKLKKVYCDNTLVDQEKAMNFTQQHPAALVIFESQELEKWWNSMSPEWKKVFGMYGDLNNPPTPEQLHRLLAIDSVNVNGRAEINTIAPVSKLVYLRHLEFTSTAVTDLEPLRDLTGLTYINGDNSKITSLASLAGLKNLKTLSINNTGVSDLSPLKPLKVLAMVYADNTGINLQAGNAFLDSNPGCLVIFQTYENTNWWKNLPQAWKDCFLDQLKLKGTPDKVQLQQIVSLKKVVISENPQITSLGNLLKLSRLEELQISGTAVASLEPVAQMKTLKILRFPKNPVTDLTPLAQHQGLREIDCSNTPVETLEPLKLLSGLEVLKISGTQVKNLKDIMTLTGLKTLEAYNTRISSLDPLEKMTALKSLIIFNTKVSEKKVQKFKSTHPGCEVTFY
jgi:Leucine-rich repeat (LRR) protein